MKKSKVLIAASLVAVLLGMSACSKSTEDEPASKDETTVDDTSQGTENSSTDISVDTESGSNNESEQSSSSSKGSTKDPSTNQSSEKNDAIVDDKETLTKYSNEQIEYARIWLQLGPNQEIDELYVRHILAGEPINPDDDNSANYPEDVIQLAGSRLVDGSVTYSGNGDGTINVYNVPLRWDGNYPVEEIFYIDIIENTKLVSVDTGDDEKIIELIKLLSIH